MLFLLVAFGASVIGSISGIGGGVIMKPVLEWLSGYGVESISFLSGCTVLVMSAVSLLRQRGSGIRFDARRGTMLALGSALGGVVGKYLFDLLQTRTDEDILGLVQAIVLATMLAGLLVYTAFQKRVKKRDVQNKAACAALGLVMGLLSAFLGIGGGPINLAILSYFLSMDYKTGALHSLYVILVSQITSLVTTLVSGAVPVFSPLVLALMVLGGVGGAFTGSAISKRVGNGAVEKLYIGVLVLVLALALRNMASYIGG